MSGPRLRPAAVAIALALAISPALTGCANPLDAIGQGIGDAVGDAVEGATGLAVENGAEIPSTFPAAVPLVAGEVTAGSALTLDGATTWSVTVVTAEPLAATFAALRESFAAAGYTEHAVAETAGTANGVFSGEHSVIVNVTTSDAGTEVMTVVTPIGQ